MDRKSDKGVRILDGSSFFVSDSLGNSTGAETDGLFFHDTRFLSVDVLRINEQTPRLMSTKNVDYFSARFFMTLPFGTIYDSHPISVVRSRLIGRGATEQILIENHSTTAVDLMVTLQFDTDFADLFEVKAGTASLNKRDIVHVSSTNGMSFTYETDKLFRQTIIEFSQSATVVDRTAYFKVNIAEKKSWTLDITIIPVIDAEQHRPKYTARSFGKARPEMKKSMNEWLGDIPELSTDLDFLVHTFNRTIVDLAALRFYPHNSKDPVLAAGLPWFMALFGRDNLITSYQTCFLAPELAHASLHDLAARQGTETVDFRDEQPGKILHELRSDQLTLEGKLPYSPYYGSSDSTPLFLVLLHEAYLWTGDAGMVRSLEKAARDALKWMDEFGDADGDGFIEYKTKSPKGLRNQCWKDSSNSIMYANGKIAEPPIAVCEIQGYAYDAKVRTAYLAEKIWKDEKLAKKLRQEAQKLKERFNEDFWTDRDGGYAVLALDKDKNQVDSHTSNMGQLLWSGILTKEHAAQVVQQLFKEDLYSGWGVRTMSTSDRGANPIGYHIGTVWPHDNSLIVAGLTNYGYRDEANKIAANLIEAAHYFEYRLPEAFAGYSRSQFAYPVEYPTACSPQAWAAGAPALLLRCMLGLKADPEKRTLEVDAYLPKNIKYMQLKNLRLFGNVYTVNVDDKGAHIEQQEPAQMEAARQHKKEAKRAAS
ncbi:MAG TPA: glycogen debranching N-terminal domain-containing protein [Candidatus Obscuribacterales bacterium]